jgi:hypothetical protein
VLPDGSIVFVMRDSRLDLSTLTGSRRTHLVKIEQDGRPGWSRTLEDAMVVAVQAFAEDASYIYVLGSTFTPGSPFLMPSYGVVARLDAATGALTHEFRVQPEENDILGSLTLFATSARYIYAGRRLTGSDQTRITEIIRMDRDLANPAAFRSPELRWQTGSGAFMDGLLLVSEFDPDIGELRAFNVNEDLQALDPACTAISFTPFPVTQAEPALTVSPFSVTLEAIDVNVAPAGTELVPTTLPVMPLALDIKECAAAPLTTQ